MLRQLFILVIFSVQPLWPASISVQRAIMQARLGWQGIHVADARKMLQAAHLDVMVFDKTGTLTSDQVCTPNQAKTQSDMVHVANAEDVLQAARLELCCSVILSFESDCMTNRL